MMDMTATVAPKSDQMNADDLIGRNRTIKVTRVAISAGDDQPVSIFYEGDDGKPFKPCKSMRRVLINVWGGDANVYAGRRMTLHRDDKVVFGGLAVGGIRISHVSDITRDVTLALTDKRGSRKPYVVKPLPAEEAAPRQEPVDDAEVERLAMLGGEAADRGTDALRAFWSGLAPNLKKAVGGAPQLSKWQARAAEIDAAEASDPELAGAVE